MPTILHEVIPATTQHIDTQLQIAQEQAFRYTAILEKVSKNPLMSKELESYMLKEAVYNIRQYEIFLQTVLVSKWYKSGVFCVKQSLKNQVTSEGGSLWNCLFTLPCQGQE